MTPRQIVAEALHDQMCRSALAGESCAPARHSGAGYSTAAKSLVEQLESAGYEIRRKTQ